MSELWWQTVPAQITLWGSATIILGTALVRFWRWAEWLRRLIITLFSIGMTIKWPNGSTDLPSSLQAIYEKLECLEEKLDEHLKDPQAA